MGRAPHPSLLHITFMKSHLPSKVRAVAETGAGAKGGGAASKDATEKLPVTSGAGPFLAVVTAGVAKGVPQNPTAPSVEKRGVAFARRPCRPRLTCVVEHRVPTEVHLAGATSPDAVEAARPAVQDAEGPFAPGANPVVRHRPLAAATPGRAPLQGAAPPPRAGVTKEAGPALLLQGSGPVGSAQRAVEGEEPGGARSHLRRLAAEGVGGVVVEVARAADGGVDGPVPRRRLAARTAEARRPLVYHPPRRGVSTMRSAERTDRVSRPRVRGARAVGPDGAPFEARTPHSALVALPAPRAGAVAAPHALSPATHGVHA